MEQIAEIWNNGKRVKWKKLKMDKEQKLIFELNIQIHIQLIKYFMKENKFQSQWGIWYTYQLEKSAQEAQNKAQNQQYQENIQLIFKVSTPSDLAYLWKHSPIALPSNYFGRQGGKVFTYVVQQKTRKVNSIEFFKIGIEPRWEDPKNEQGGRLVFQVPKSQKSNEIYQGFIFYLMGQDFEMSERLNGFRFISSKTPTTVSFRAEIWFHFNNDDTQTLSKYKEIFEKMFTEVGYEHAAKTVKFINMKGQEKKEYKKEEKADPAP